MPRKFGRLSLLHQCLHHSQPTIEPFPGNHSQLPHAKQSCRCPMCEASGPFLLLHQATSLQLPTFRTMLRCVVIGINQLHFRPSIVPLPKIHVGLPCLKLSSHLLQHSYQLWLRSAMAPLPAVSK